MSEIAEMRLKKTVRQFVAKIVIEKFWVEIE